MDTETGEIKEFSTEEEKKKFLKMINEAQNELNSWIEIKEKEMTKKEKKEMQVDLTSNTRLAKRARKHRSMKAFLISKIKEKK